MGGVAEGLRLYDRILPKQSQYYGRCSKSKIDRELYYVRATKMPILVELRKLNVELNVNARDCILATLKVRPLLMERIVQAE